MNRYVFFTAVILAVACTHCARLFGPSRVWETAGLTEPTSLDWVAASDKPSELVLRQTQRSLADLSEGFSLDVSGRRFTYVLSKDRWSDGVDVSAQDFVFAWKRHLQPGVQTPWTAILLEIEGAKDYHSGKSKDFAKVGVRAKDRSILEIVLAKANPKFPEAVAHPALGPQREDIYMLHPKDFASPLHLRCIGPYQVLDWKKGESLLLVENSYASVRPGVAKVRLRFAPTSTQAEHDKGLVSATPLDAQGFPIFSQVSWRN